MSENLPTAGVPMLDPLAAAHPGLSAPSAWLVRFAPLIATGAKVLDYACGSGRHARWLAGRGMQVDAVDRDAAALARLQGVAGVTSARARARGRGLAAGGRAL